MRALIEAIYALGSLRSHIRPLVGRLTNIRHLTRHTGALSLSVAFKHCRPPHHRSRNGRALPLRLPAFAGYS